MKRTLAIVAVFVVLNTLGVVYRVVVGREEPAGAIIAPIAPAMASERPLEPAARPAVIEPPISVALPAPAAIETPAPTPQETGQEMGQEMRQIAKQRPSDRISVG